MISKFLPVFILILAACSNRKEHDIDHDLNPSLKLREDSLYLGAIPLGNEIDSFGVLINSGTRAFHVLSVVPSCGCTSVHMATNVLSPGDTSRIYFSIQTGIKGGGPIQKKITFNTDDSTAKKLVLLISAILNDPHSDSRMKSLGIQGIFKGTCANCHSKRGIGLLDFSLYSADCGICHASGNNSIPRLRIIQTMTRDSIKKIVSYGVRGSNMPAFSHSHGGPLTQVQIENLINYLHPD